MPKLLAATKINPLDRFLLSNEELRLKGFDVIMPSFENIYDLTGIAAAEGGGSESAISPPVIVLSSMTSGKRGPAATEALYGLRALGYRVVLLPGDRAEDSTKSLVREAVKKGIYDFVYDPYTGDNVVFRLLNPATLADADLDLEDEDKPESIEDDEDNCAGAPGGVVKRLAEKVTGYVQLPVNSRANPVSLESGPGSAIHNKKRKTDKLVTVLGIGNPRIEEWIKSNFSDQMTVLASPVEPEEIMDKITGLSPDICIFMRQGTIGGIAGADKLAVWAAKNVPAVLFIVGELDDEGKRMVTRAKDAGIRHIITCERGGQIYGDELVFVLTTIVREMHQDGVATVQDEESATNITKKTVDSLIKGASLFGKALKDSAGAASEKTASKAKKTKPKINRSEGISIDEAPRNQLIVNNLKNPTAIVPGGVLAVVSPWRPNLAGRLAAQAVKMFSEVEGSEVAYIGTSKNSTGAMWLDVPDEVLMMSDWRVPGSNSPLARDNIRIYAVDPAKNLSPNIEADLWGILKEARKNSTYTVMDFAGDIALAEKAAHQGCSVLLVVLPGNDPVEYKISSLWLRNVMDGKQNIVTGIDLRGASSTIPEGIRPGVVIRNNPADSLTLALKKISRDEFIWN